MDPSWEWRIFDQFLKAELEIDGNSLELSLELSTIHRTIRPVVTKYQ